MIRWLLYRFIPYYFLLLSLIGGVLVLSSDTGLQLIWQAVSKKLPESISIEQVRGRLIGQISVRGFEFRQDERSIRIDHAWLRWQPLALLHGQIRISEIVIANTHVAWPEQVQDKDPAQQALPLPARFPTIRIDRLQLQSLSVLADTSAEPFQLDRLRLSALLRQQSFEIDVTELSSARFGDWSLSLAGELAGQEFLVHKLAARGLSQPRLRLSAAGRCSWPDLTCESSLQWSHLRWPFFEPRWWSAAGQAGLKRQGEKLELDADAELWGDQLPASRIQVWVKQEVVDGPLQYTLDWLGQAGQVQAAGSYRLSDQLLRSEVRLEAFDLAPWLPDYPSQINGLGNIELAMNPTPVLRINSFSLNGQLRGESAKLSGNGYYQTGEWSAQNLLLQIGENSISGHLQRSKDWKGELQLKAQDLSQFHPTFEGKLNATAILSGTTVWPNWQFSALGRELRFAEYRLAQLNINGKSAAQRIDLSIQLQDLISTALNLRTLQFRTQGDERKLVSLLEFDEAHAQGQLTFASLWQPSKEELMVTIEKGQLTLDQEVWNLRKPGKMHWQRKTDQFDLARQCWESSGVETCLQGQWADKQLGAQMQVDHYPLKRLARLLPESAHLTGNAMLNLKISPSPLDQLQSQLDVETSRIQLRDAQDPQTVLLDFLPGKITANARGQALEAAVNIPTSTAPGLVGDLRLAENRELQGHLKLILNDIGVIGIFIPEVLQSKGVVNADVGITGSLEQPKITGILALKDGNFVLDTPETRLQNFNLSLQAGEESKLAIQLRTESGDGYLRMTGGLDWQQAWRFHGQVTGENFLAFNSQEFLLETSPQLKFEATDAGVQLEGRILVPKADIRPRSLIRESALTASTDQIILGQAVEKRSSMALNSQITLELGDQVRISGFGLKAGLRGKLKAINEPGRIATGTGELKLIDGRYQAYGQDLHIEYGRLIYTGGPLSEPGLDIKAYRQANSDVRAGVLVRGPLKKPEFTLYSDPLLRETDQLSYLVLGRAAEAQSDSDQAALNNAALALGLKGGDFLANRLKGKLGIDEVRIGAEPGESTQQASLILGKYLSPEIYVSYGIGLFEPVSTFRLRYQLARQWMLQTESGVESGGDVFYTIER